MQFVYPLMLFLLFMIGVPLLCYFIGYINYIAEFGCYSIGYIIYIIEFGYYLIGYKITLQNLGIAVLTTK